MTLGAGTDVRHHEHLRTSCGRDLTIGRLALGDAAHPAGRVFIDLGKCRDCNGGAWAGLSPAEARRLAAALLSQAAAADRTPRTGMTCPAGSLSVTSMVTGTRSPHAGTAC